MNTSDPDTIEIRDRTELGVPRFELLVDGCHRALVTGNPKNGEVNFHWGVYGPVHHQEAKVMLQGLLELSMVADQLELELKNGKKKK